MAPATARAESTAELLCAELAVDGLPMDRAVAEQVLIAGFVGPRPRVDGRGRGAAGRPGRRGPAPRARGRDRVRPAQPGPGEVAARPGRRRRARHPGLAAASRCGMRIRWSERCSTWRKAERIATTYGYALARRAPRRRRPAARRVDRLGRRGRPDDRVGRAAQHAGRAAPGRGRRARPRVRPGRPRPDRAAGAGRGVRRPRPWRRRPLGDDLYAPVAAQLGVDRATAKVAVLGAMYGQTTGHGAQALRRLDAAYPVAMAYLDAADRAGRAGRDLRTYGGRLIRMGSARRRRRGQRPGRDAAGPRPAAGTARNAMVQGAAAELFKVWAVTVRARCAPLGARIVLCLHDELLVHAPRRARRARWPGWSTTACRRPRTAGRPTTRSASSPTSASSTAGPTPRPESRVPRGGARSEGTDGGWIRGRARLGRDR